MKHKVPKVFTLSYGAIEINNDVALTNIEKNKFEKDYLDATIGAFGGWQAKVCILAALTRSIATWNMLSIVFLTPSTEFACVKFRNDVNVTAANSTCYESCDEYKFYEEIFDTTLISEFNLICENAWLASFTQTILMFGVLVGVSVFGWMSDRYGRRTALLIAMIINVILMLAAPFSPNYWTLTALRFFIGMGTGATLIITVVIILEVVGPQYREWAGAFALLPDGFAEASLSGFAYYSSTWNKYLLGQGFASILILLCVILLPESPRWLVSRSQEEKALKVIKNAAKCNGLSTTDIKQIVAVEVAKTKTVNKDATSYIDLFKTKETSIITLSMAFIWLVSGMCFYGINQYVTFLGSDTYITVILVGLIQVPITPMSIPINRKFKRRVTLISTFVAFSASMVILIFIPKDHWVGTLLGVIGVGITSTTFVVIYIYTSELFPTPLRNMGYGIGSAGAKVGAMMAPFVASMAPKWIPSIIFAVIACAVSGFCFLLPETKGQKLRDTL